MWIIQEPNTLELLNKLHFEEEKKNLKKYDRKIYHMLGKGVPTTKSVWKLPTKHIYCDGNVLFFPRQEQLSLMPVSLTSVQLLSKPADSSSGDAKPTVQTYLASRTHGTKPNTCCTKFITEPNVAHRGIKSVAPGGPVGWGTVPQAGTSRFRFPLGVNSDSNRNGYRGCLMGVKAGGG